ncbi:MAG: Rrf2 family transcriptional regulator [Planctomycetales bacterium]|nr:Rrf2 family transcriptional regulator [Planctomycetales bacterium]
MKISAKVEYACTALLELAGQFDTGQPARIRSIAAEHSIPQRFLVQILLQLKGAGLVASTRGAGGGYQLARPPEEITLGEVIRIIEGPPTSEDADTTVKRSPAAQVLRKTWAEVAAAEQAMLDRVTFADLAERCQKFSEDMYYI